MSDPDAAAVRLDKWLWAARLFKTRQLAIEAIEMGRVLVGDGQRAKPAKAVHIGDRLVVRRPPYETVLIVRAVAEKRVAAPIARTYYDETAESRAQREQLAADIAAQPPPLFRGRPTKRDRRQLERWQHASVTDED